MGDLWPVTVRVRSGSVAGVHIWLGSPCGVLFRMTMAMSWGVIRAWWLPWAVTHRSGSVIAVVSLYLRRTARNGGIARPWWLPLATMAGSGPVTGAVRASPGAPRWMVTNGGTARPSFSRAVRAGAGSV